MNEEAVRRAFHDQAMWCDSLGSPFTAQLMRAVEPILDRSTELGRTCCDWPGNPDARNDSVPLRLAGALQALVLAGQVPDLAALYPPGPLPPEAELGAVLPGIFGRHGPFLLDFLRFAPQTNEVARSGVLYPGMMEITRFSGKPLALFELGASAGLNLALDRFFYRLGGAEGGNPASPVRLQPAWSGPSLEPVPITVASRRGCDINALDIHDPAQRARLRAYVWADQADRIARFEAAVGIASTLPIHLDTMEAAAWIERNLKLDETGATCPVLFHTIAAQYFPDESNRRIAAHMERLGAKATSLRPLAWLSFEQVPNEGCLVMLRLWPGGEMRVLAKADPHGRKVEWRG